jgi:hypothetical protein
MRALLERIGVEPLSCQKRAAGASRHNYLIEKELQLN